MAGGGGGGGGGGGLSEGHRDGASPPPVLPPAVTGSSYVSRDAVELAHGLLGVLPAHGVGFQEFFDLLQREGEDRRLLDLRDEGLDDVVPVEVVRDFALRVLQGFDGMFRDIVPAAGAGTGGGAGTQGRPPDR